MKDNKITVVFDKKDSQKFNYICEKTQWSDKYLVTVILRDFYEKFKGDWKKVTLAALERHKTKKI